MTETQRLEFLKNAYPHAKRVERKTGFNAVAILAQAAGECGWEEPPGHMYFGVKDTDGLNGNEQLIRTKEVLPSPNKTFPKIYSVEKIVTKSGIKYLYDVETHFRKYNSPEESFNDHADFLLRNPRYSKALEVKDDPRLFLSEIADAGYATGPQYKKFMLNMVYSVEKRLKKLKLI